MPQPPARIKPLFRKKPTQSDGAIKVLEVVGAASYGCAGKITDGSNAPMKPKSRNISDVDSLVSDAERHARHGHRGGVLWFTGLPCSGKATLATALERALFDDGYRVLKLQSADFRRGVCADLGFSPDDRREHIRRVGEVAALAAHSGIIVLTAFISPFQAGRDHARRAAGDGFHEIFLNPGIAVCERRDTKGVYARARAGEIADFTGISAPYEEPTAPELEIDTGRASAVESLEILTDYVKRVLS